MIVLYFVTQEQEQRNEKQGWYRVGLVWSDNEQE